MPWIRVSTARISKASLTDTEYALALHQAEEPLEKDHDPSASKGSCHSLQLFRIVLKFRHFMYNGKTQPEMKRKTF